VFSSTSKGSRHDGGLSSFGELFTIEEQGAKSKPWSMVVEEVVTWYGAVDWVLPCWVLIRRGTLVTGRRAHVR